MIPIDIGHGWYKQEGQNWMQHSAIRSMQVECQVSICILGRIMQTYERGFARFDINSIIFEEG